jgi:hypothetical protein
MITDNSNKSKYQLLVILVTKITSRCFYNQSVHKFQFSDRKTIRPSNMEKLLLASATLLNLGRVGSNSPVVDVLFINKSYRSGELTFTLPVTGDGWYGLYISTTYGVGDKDETYSFDAMFNNHTFLRKFHLVETLKSGKFQVYNKIVYFSICNGVLHCDGTSFALQDNRLVLSYKFLGFASGLLLAKGEAGGRRTVFPGEPELWFDPALEEKCFKS